jgi:Dehydrogenases with different specificities (related to short-chain alcohol dehydrogenases)
MNMQKKIALVTGGSRGLGKDMALSLAAKGIDVILTYHSQKEEAEKVVKEIESGGQKAAALPFDAGDTRSLDHFLQEVLNLLKKVWNRETFDFLINNAGVGATLPIPNVKEEDFDRLMNIHFKSVFFLTQKALPHMNDHGGVVFISSGTTRFCAPGYSVYSSLKGAVEVFTRYVAKEFGSRGIRSNIVAPGPIETDFNNAIIRSNPQIKSFLTGQTTLGRVGNADDIGSVVAFLCTEESKWINGQRIEVSGGVYL